MKLRLPWILAACILLVLQAAAVMANQAPVFTAIQDVTIQEDGNASDNAINLNNYASDADNNTLSYRIASQSNQSIAAAAADANFIDIGAPAPNANGASRVCVVANDGTVDSAEACFNINVAAVNDMPVIDSFSPSTAQLSIAEDANKTFSVTASDVDSGTLSVAWYVNNAQRGTGASFTYNANSAIGTFTVRADVSDGTAVASKSWSLTVSDRPVASTFDGSTTDFSQIANLISSANVVLEKSAFGKINFSGSLLDLRDVADLDNNVAMASGLIGIDTAALPQLNKPATLTMYNVNFASNPVIYYTNSFTTDKNLVNSVCTFCNVVSRDSNKVVFTTTQFSTFAVKEGSVVSKLAIRDLDIKMDGKTERNVKDGETIGEEIMPGETVELVIDVENTFSKSEKIEIRDIRVEAVFKKIDVDDEDLEEESSDFDLSEDDHEKKTLIFNIPYRVDEDTYEMEITVEGKDENGNTHRVDWSLFFEVKRKNHDVAISGLELEPQLARCDSHANLQLEIANRGDKREEDAGYDIISNALGINAQKSGIFLDDDADSEDSEYRESIRIELEKDLEPGIYPIVARASYDGKFTDEKRIDLTVEECVRTAAKPATPETQVVVSSEAPASAVQKKMSFTESAGYITLLAGIYVVILAAIVFAAVFLLRRK